MTICFHAPMEFLMRLGHAWGCKACTPCTQKVGAQMSFLASVLGKARTFSPKPGRNSHYKYQSSLISRSELEQFKRKSTLELRESFYLLL